MQHEKAPLKPLLSVKKSWYLVMSKPNQDERAEHNLLAQHYEVYRPMACVPKVRRGKRVHVVESLFPRYLFVRLDERNDNWAPIRSTFGVSQLIRFGLNAAKVTDELVAFLQENESTFEQKAIDLVEFKADDRVFVMQGTLKGTEAIFKCYDAKQRAILLLTFLGQQQSVVVPTETIVSAD